MQNGFYAEYLGNIKQVNDSTFHIAAVMTLGQFYCMSHGAIQIGFDSAIAQELGQITLTYANGTFKRLLTLDRRGRSKMGFEIPVDQKLFNSNRGTDYYTLSIPRKHPITGKALTFKIGFGSAARFKSGKKIDFEVSIKNGMLWTVGEPPLDTGPFKLRKISN